MIECSGYFSSSITTNNTMNNTISQSVQSLSHVQFFATHSMPGFPVHHQLLEFTQTHVH